MKIMKEPTGAYSETYYAFTETEMKAILPAIQREQKHAEKMSEGYRDLILDGYGTDRQCTAQVKWEDKARLLGGIIDDAKAIGL